MLLSSLDTRSDYNLERHPCIFCIVQALDEPPEYIADERELQLLGKLKGPQQHLEPLRGVSAGSIRAGNNFHYSILGLALVKSCYQNLSHLHDSAIEPGSPPPN